MHKNFAYVYDKFMEHVDYKSWYKFLRKYIKKPASLLDIGCGTATLTNMFYNDNFSVSAIDISKDMLNVAKKKNDKIKYHHLDITKECLNEKFEYITCNFDTVNYFSSNKDFENFVKHCSKMQDKGYLIFDLVLEGIFDEIFENDLFIDETETYTSIWYYERKSKYKHSVQMVNFLKVKDNIYEKYIEQHTKHIYDMEKVMYLLNKYGYDVYDIAKNPKYGDNRLFIVAKK